jgi:hypothetical protein
VAANSARDVGGRLMALTIWGKEASGGSYAAIAALTNIPATLCAVLFYEFFLADTARGVSLLPWVALKYTYVLRWQSSTLRR